MKSRIRASPLVLLLIALLMTACAATRRQTTHNLTQEASTASVQKAEGGQNANLAELAHTQMQAQTMQTQTLLLDAESIPAARAEMTIPIRSLLSLPQGAKYATQSGRALVEAERRGEDLLIVGKMDSIARRCLYYENQAFRQQQTSDSLQSLLASSRETYWQLDSMAQAQSRTSLSAEIRERPPATWYWWLLAGILAGGSCVAWLTGVNPMKIISSLIKKLL